MYIPSRVFSNTTFNESVYITEYFPISRKTQHGVMIPTYQNGQISVLFKDLIPKYNLGNQCCTNMPNQEPLLSFEDYKFEFLSLLERMNNIHGGRVSFRHKDIKIMYETYRALHGKKYIAGLISIVRDRIMNSVKDNLAVPPEAYVTTVGFETFVAGLKRDLPMLTLDYYTASHMYDMYRTNVCHPDAPTEDIPFLIDCPDNKSLATVVGAAGNYLSRETVIATVINNTMSDNVLAQYYATMQRLYGVRERIAKALLMYHPTVIEQNMQGLRNTLGIISDREIVWSKSFEAVQHSPQDIDDCSLF